jgi:hypothetical protein
MCGSQCAKGSKSQFLKSLQRKAELLSKAASLLLNGGSNNVGFRPENLGGALRRERIWQLLRPEKTKERKQRRNTGTRGRNKMRTLCPGVNPSQMLCPTARLRRDSVHVEGIL